MKVIITGATGLVGNAVVQYCLANSKISEIVVISRRKLPKAITDDPKITVILHEDFLSWPVNVLEKLRGAEACLWALGLRGAPLGYADAAYAEKVDVQYPVAAAEAFAEHLCSGSKFRFVLCSGIGAEMDPEKSIWGMRETRLLKGRAERALHAIDERTERFEVYTCRPFGIWPEKPSWFEWAALSIMPSVKGTELAATMTDLGIRGSEQWIWENSEIGEKGREVLVGVADNVH